MLMRAIVVKFLNMPSKEEYIFLVRVYFKNKLCVQARSNEFQNFPLPMELAILKLAQKFIRTGSVQDVPCSGRPHMATTAAMQVKRQIVEQHVQTSTRHLVTCVLKSRSNVGQCLQKVRMKPYSMSCL